jgi:hypothetical protein
MTGDSRPCFPLFERLLWLAIFAGAAYFGAARGTPAPSPEVCPCPAPCPCPRPRRDDLPTVEAAPQRAIVGRRRDGQWVRVDVVDGVVEETVISQGVVRPPGRGEQQEGLGP